MNSSGACCCDALPPPLSLRLTLFRLSAGRLRLTFRGRGRLFWMGDRAVDCAHLESVCAKGTGGSNPPPSAVDRLLWIVLLVRVLTFTPFDHLQLLPQFHHAAVGKHAAEIYTGINHAVATDD